jgi:(2Fe-2S) ferredoxin
MAAIWQQPYRGRCAAVCEDRPAMQNVADGVRLELTGAAGVWTIELSRDDCERIAEEIGYRRPRQEPWE